MSTIKKAQNGVKATKDSTTYFKNKVNEVSGKIKKEIPNLPRFKSTDPDDNKRSQNMRNLVSEKKKAISNQLRQSNKGKPGYDANGFPKKKDGGMIKRADGSSSKRGLYDNIRANKGSGKKPTAAMLKQEKKIKAKAKK